MKIKTITLFALLVSGNAFAAPIVTNNISYCPAVPTLEMNIAQPASMVAGQTYPTIMFIHGGGWRVGDRTVFQSKITEAANRGYIGATVSYRLTSTTALNTGNFYTDPRYQVGAQGYDLVHDVKCALKFLKQNAATYQIDAAKIGVAGASAGGHLSLMLGLSHDPLFNQSLGLSVADDLSVAAIVDWHGPTSDLPNVEVVTGSVTLLASFLGCTYDSNTHSWMEPTTALTRPDGTGVTCSVKDAELAPLNHIDANDPPLMIFQGGMDTTVDKSQSIKLDQAVTGGGIHSFRFYPDLGHQTTIEGWVEAFNFFDIHLKGVIDTSPPVITAPANLYMASNGATGISATSPEPSAFLKSAHAFDNAGIVGAITHDAPATFPLGTTVVTFSATDQAGFKSTATSSLIFGEALSITNEPVTASNTGGCLVGNGNMWWIGMLLLLLLQCLYRKNRGFK